VASSAAPAQVESRAKGKLACSTRPAGAEIFVDGRSTNRTTPVSVNNPLLLPVGSHKVVFKLDGKESGPHNVVISEDEPQKLTNIVLE
jgi:hypothetical protein